MRKFVILITALLSLVWLAAPASASIDDAKTTTAHDSHQGYRNGWSGTVELYTSVDMYRDYSGSPNNNNDDRVTYGVDGNNDITQFNNWWTGWQFCPEPPGEDQLCWTVTRLNDSDISFCDVKVQKLDLAGANNYVVAWHEQYVNDGAISLPQIWIDWDKKPRVRVECAFDNSGSDAITGANLITKNAWLPAWTD